MALRVENEKLPQPNTGLTEGIAIPHPEATQPQTMEKTEENSLSPEEMLWQLIKEMKKNQEERHKELKGIIEEHNKHLQEISEALHTTNLESSAKRLTKPDEDQKLNRKEQKPLLAGSEDMNKSAEDDAHKTVEINGPHATNCMETGPNEITARENVEIISDESPREGMVPNAQSESGDIETNSDGQDKVLFKVEDETKNLQKETIQENLPIPQSQVETLESCQVGKEVDMTHEKVEYEEKDRLREIDNEENVISFPEFVKIINSDNSPPGEDQINPSDMFIGQSPLNYSRSHYNDSYETNNYFRDPPTEEFAVLILLGEFHGGFLIPEDDRNKRVRCYNKTR